MLISFSLFSWLFSTQTSFPALQNDDVEFYDNQSGYWKIVPVLEPIASRYGWRNSRILKATSEGMGKLTASLVYYNGHHDIKEVRCHLPQRDWGN